MRGKGSGRYARKENERTKVFRFRLNEVELATLSRLAEYEQRKRPEMLRELIRAAAADRGLWPLAKAGADLDALRGVLGAGAE